MPKQVTCPFCGQLTSDDRNFCRHCGTRVKSPTDDSASFLGWHEFSWRQKWYWLPLRLKSELEFFIFVGAICAVMGSGYLTMLVMALPDLPKTKSVVSYVNVLTVVELMFGGVAVLYSQISNKMKDEPQPGDYDEPEDEPRK